MTDKQRLEHSRAKREDDPAWRNEWVSGMRANFVEKAQDQDFEEKNLEWLDAKAKNRNRKLSEIRTALFGPTPDYELTARQTAEWENLQDAIADLDTCPDALFVKESKLNLMGMAQSLAPYPKPAAGQEKVLPDEAIEVFEGQPWVSPYHVNAILEEYEKDADELARPTFEYLNMPALEQHATRLSSHLAAWTQPPSSHILRFESRQYIDLNPTKRTERRSAKIVLMVTVADLNLTELQGSVLKELAGKRYGAENDELRLVGTRLPTPEMNREYLKNLLARLVTESKRVASEIAKQDGMPIAHAKPVKAKAAAHKTLDIPADKVASIDLDDTNDDAVIEVEGASPNKTSDDQSSDQVEEVDTTTDTSESVDVVGSSLPSAKMDAPVIDEGVSNIEPEQVAEDDSAKAEIIAVLREEPDAYSKAKLNELREVCVALGLDKKGNKVVLTSRIQEFAESL